MFEVLKSKEIRRELLFLYFVILIPQIFGRQLFYYVALIITRNPSFIDSFETLWMAKNGFLPWMGIMEEIGIGLFYVFLILIDRRFWFFIYGWIFDSWQDMMTAITWVLWRFDYTHLIAGSFAFREFIREILIPYMIVGPIIYILVRKFRKK